MYLKEKTGRLFISEYKFYTPKYFVYVCVTAKLNILILKGDTVTQVPFYFTFFRTIKKQLVYGWALACVFTTCGVGSVNNNKPSDDLPYFII